ncbi:MAG TPA: ABC transporter substrate-binding protein [Stellaceae bacterium]|nr:ABC transporter substrate-binding protein [Stellaceae bacterium]
MTPLGAAIGRCKHTEALFEDPLLRIESFPVINRAFAPMVRTQCFDVSEMAIATFLMARAGGSDLVLLPIVLAARFQNGALLRRAADAFGPDDLRGRRVGVRAYSQTTGLWLRGTLEEEYGVRPDQVRWVTFEDAHVASFRDPPWAERAPPGSDMLRMLREGRLDAAIFGNDLPAAPDLATVFPDPDAAGQRFLARHRFMPVNHLVVVSAETARRKDLIRLLLDRFRAAGNPFPFGRAALDPAIALAVRYAVEQRLLPRALSLDEVWAGLPPGCDE